MKQIVVVSDSHGNTSLLKDIVNKHPNASLFLHAGDSEEFESNIYPFISVKGNNDYYIDNEYKIIEFESYRIYLTHGHKMILTKENLARKAKANNCNIIIFGHTHRPFCEQVDNVYILNPGSLSYPRSSIGQTYALISIQDDKTINVEHCVL